MANFYDFRITDCKLRQIANGDECKLQVLHQHFGRKSVERDRLRDLKWANSCSLQCRHDGGGAEGGAKVSAERTDISATATFDIHIEFWILVTKHIDPMNRDRACLELEIGAFTGELVGPASRDFYGRVRRRS